MTDKTRSPKAVAADPHAARESEKYAAPIASREYILDTLRDEGAPIDLEALGERLGLVGDADAEEALRRRVRAMIRDGQLIENRRRGLVPVDAESLVAGRISAHPDGFGFLVSEERDKDVFLSAREMRQVLHGDKVVVNITGEDRRGRPEGRIVDVVERANRSLVGRLSIDHGIATVAADSKRIHQDLLVEPGQRNGAEHGDMVVAEITEQPTRRQQPLGRIAEVLGQHLTPGMEIDVALHTHGIPVEWPEAVTEQAASFSTTVRQKDAVGRKDVRELPLVTIDGADARDFDDAVWCEPTSSEGGDGWRLVVAIADVAHYVSPGSALDEEAVLRGTSVYFPGRVVPMLPEVLSNGLCSLNPEVDRLCMLCDMSLDEHGKVRKARFHNGVMRSHARLTYSKVHEILTEPDSALREEYAPLVPMIENLHRLYEVLAKARRKRGAIEFESNETRIVFDGERKISELVPVTRNDAHKLIEECMILANIQAAAFLESQEIPALYRVHNGPKADRLEDLRAFLALHGLTVGGGATPSATDYAKLSREIQDRPDRSVIQTVMLRSMQQAVYQPKNEGHFGLALEQYAHFTSPIRRYPDLLVHRAIKHAISREKNAAYGYSSARMQSLGESCSTYERRAEEASRDVVSWLKCEYMQQHVGGEFEGVVSAVTSFGLFVNLTGIHVEGLIHITNLARDYYRFDAAAHSLVGERTGQVYRLGDPMVVQVAAVNLDERKIDFAEVSHTSTQKRGKATRPPEAAAANDAGRGEGEGRKRKRKRSKNKRRRERENVPVVAMEGIAPGAGDDVQQAPVTVQGEGGGASRTDAASSDKATNPEHRRQLKRREKQRRRDEKRRAQRAEKRAAAEAARGASGTDDAEASAAATAAVESATGSEKAGGRKPERRRSKGGAAAREVTAAQAQGATGEEATSGRASTGWASRKVPDETDTSAGVAARDVATEAAVSAGSAKKASAKKAAAKAAVKKVAKKAAAGKASAKKATAKKVAKKAAAGKASAKKAAAKVAAKKAAAGKASAKKAAAKVAAKKVAKKAAAGKASAKKTAAKKVAKKAAAGKASAKKVAGQLAAKKAAAKKAGAAKSTAKAAPRKSVGTSAKKAAAKKTSAKKVAANKVAAKKAGAARVAGKAAPRESARTSAKKVASKQTGAARTAAKVATGKVTAKKASASKAASKVATKKAVAKKTAAKKKAGSGR